MGKIVVYSYLLIGILFILLNKNLNNLYIGLLIFFTFKVAFNYRKCTVSYIECKLRGVKKEKGYLNRFMDSIIDLRQQNESVFYYIASFLILFYHFIDKGNNLNI